MSLLAPEWISDIEASLKVREGHPIEDRHSEKIITVEGLLGSRGIHEVDHSTREGARE